jgi:sugar transferase (PEP-CTERM system associated)
VIRFLHAYFPARTVFLGLSEACLVTLAFIAATIARFGTFDGTIILNYQQGFIKIVVVAAIFIVCMYYFDLYDSMVLSNRREVLTRLVQVVGTSCVILAGLYYVYPPLELGRGVLVVGIVLVALLLAGWRRLFLLLNSLPRFAERTLLLGDGPLAENLASEFERRSELGVRLIGRLDTNGAGGTSPASPDPAWLEELSRVVESRQPSRIIVTMRDCRGRLPVEPLLRFKSQGVRIQDGAEVYETVTGKVPIESLRLSWLLFSPGFHISRWLLLYKRVFALAVSAFGLLLCAPLMALIAIAIRLDSAGPIIFRQKRVGKDGKTFTLYKFRSMYDGADPEGNHAPAQEGDGRFTRVGRRLRRARVDELPQIYNVLRGDMYFVGPRPFVPNQEDECAEKIPFYRQRWAVKPGVTGWAQVNRDYCATLADNTEKLAYDLFYIKNMSIGLDVLILLKTAKILLLGRGSR